MSAEEGTPPAEAELRAMKVSALKKRAKEAGVGEAELEEADDADDVKGTLIALIVAREPAEQLRAELAGMKPSALKKRAKEVGVEEGKLEEADDADDVKGTLIALIVARAAEQLREELAGMKPSALKKRAKEAGVEEGKLEDADDAADVKATLIELIVEEQLRKELASMKPSALKKRAKEAGVEEEKLEEADDADDVKGTLVELIVEKARDESQDRPSTAVKPHFGTADSGGSKAERLKALFGGKHCMFSYNWAVQEQVKAARTEVGAAGVPTWMDIDCGMKADIYDSMAEGVTNAACLVCFMTQAYQDSDNCALELKFARQSGVPIVPVMMEAPDSSGRPWQAGGWLGVITAGSLWTPLYDPASFAENIPNLLRQIEIAADEDDDDASAADVSADDAREELERLRKDEQGLHDILVSDLAPVFEPEPEPESPLDTVLAMGFSQAEAAAALAACGGDAARAIERLLAAQERAAEEARRREEAERRRLEEERRRQEEEERARKVAQFQERCFADAATAQRCLEAAGWDLQRAIESYMPPVPDSPVVGRTLSTSNFKAAYSSVDAPEGPMDLGEFLSDLMKGYCKQEGIDWKAEGRPFFKKLQREAMRNMDDPIHEMMQRMWTSALTLRGREFCFILNRAVRGDEPPLADSTAGISRGINKLCVTAGGAAVAVHPPGNVCLRGGGFDDRYRSFFFKGRKFRQPAYLATSFSEAVARRFIEMRGGSDCVLWRVRIDPARKCVHVNLVNKTNVPGEEEYLFAPYSAFTVLSAQWNAGTVAAPHEIELLAAVDNKEEPEDLPLAPWS